MSKLNLLQQNFSTEGMDVLTGSASLMIKGGSNSCKASKKKSKKSKKSVKSNPSCGCACPPPPPPPCGWYRKP